MKRSEFVKYLRDLGNTDPELGHRQTGRSLAIALRTVAEALANPNKKVKITDHYTGNAINVILRDVQIPQIVRIISQLNLKGFILDKTHLTLEFDLDKMEY